MAASKTTPDASEAFLPRVPRMNLPAAFVAVPVAFEALLAASKTPFVAFRLYLVMFIVHCEAIALLLLDSHEN